MTDIDPAFKRSQSITDLDKKLQDPNSNKLLHLVVVQDPLSKPVKYFFTSNCDKGSYGVEFKGFEIKKTEIGSIKTWIEALEMSQKKKLEIISLFVPWEKIVYIQNLSYKPKGV